MNKYFRMFFSIRKDKGNFKGKDKTARYEKLGKYWPYCARERAITNAYFFKIQEFSCKKVVNVVSSRQIHYQNQHQKLSNQTKDLSWRRSGVFISNFKHILKWYLFVGGISFLVNGLILYTSTTDMFHVSTVSVIN